METETQSVAVAEATTALGYCCRQLLKCCDKFCCGPGPHLYAKWQQFLMMRRAGSCRWKWYWKLPAEWITSFWPAPNGEWVHRAPGDLVVRVWNPTGDESADNKVHWNALKLCVWIKTKRILTKMWMVSERGLTILYNKDIKKCQVQRHYYVQKLLQKSWISFQRFSQNIGHLYCISWVLHRPKSRQ